MPRKKKEAVIVPMSTTDTTPVKVYSDDSHEVLDNPAYTGTVLEQLGRIVDIPDDKPSGISLRDQAVLHLVATAELHRFPNDVDMQTHRIKRCIDIANLVVKLLGEDA